MEEKQRALEQRIQIALASASPQERPELGKALLLFFVTALSHFKSDSFFILLTLSSFELNSPLFFSSLSPLSQSPSFSSTPSSL